MKKLFLTLLFLINSPVMAQMGDFMDDDIELGSDIFSDFSEDITQKEMAEDERFYRYGRFFSFEKGIYCFCHFLGLNLRFPDLCTCPREGFVCAESESDVKKYDLQPPEAANGDKPHRTTPY